MPADSNTPPVDATYWQRLLDSRYDPEIGRPGVMLCTCGVPVALEPIGDGQYLKVVNALDGATHAEFCPTWRTKHPGEYPLWDWPPPKVDNTEVLVELRNIVAEFTSAVDEMRRLSSALARYTQNPARRAYTRPQIPEAPAYRHEVAPESVLLDEASDSESDEPRIYFGVTEVGP